MSEEEVFHQALSRESPGERAAYRDRATRAQEGADKE
jgi:hypothetical protein